MLTLPRDFAGRMKVERTSVSLPDENTLIAAANIQRILLVVSLPASAFESVTIAPFVLAASETGLTLDVSVDPNLHFRFSDWGGVLLEAFYGWGSFGLPTVNVMDVSWIDT